MPLISPAERSASSAAPPAAGRELIEIAAHARLLGVVAEIEIVNQNQVDTIQRQPLGAVLIGAHQPIGGVVELEVEGQSADPRRGVEGLGIRGPKKDAADLGR